MFLNGNKDTKSSNTEKPKKHVQFSKKVVFFFDIGLSFGN